MFSLFGRGRSANAAPVTVSAPKPQTADPKAKPSVPHSAYFRNTFTRSKPSPVSTKDGIQEQLTLLRLAVEAKDYGETKNLVTKYPIVLFEPEAQYLLLSLSSQFPEKGNIGLMNFTRTQRLALYEYIQPLLLTSLQQVRNEENKEMRVPYMNMSTNSLRTILHHVFEHGSKEEIEFWVALPSYALGNMYISPDTSGEYPLHALCRNPDAALLDERVLFRILHASSNVKEQMDKNGVRPLALAIAHRNYLLGLAMVKCGTNPYLTNLQRFTGLDLLQLIKKDDLVKEFHLYGDIQLLEPASKGILVEYTVQSETVQVDPLECMLAFLTSVSAQSTIGNTRKTLAMNVVSSVWNEPDQQEMLAWLILHGGMNPSVKTSNGIHMLHCAVYSGSLAFTHSVLDNGGYTLLLDKDDQGLSVIAYIHPPKYQRILRTLTQYAKTYLSRDDYAAFLRLVDVYPVTL